MSCNQYLKAFLSSDDEAMPASVLCFLLPQHCPFYKEITSVLDAKG